MPVGWALVRRETGRQTNFDNLAQRLKTEARQENKPWANSVKFNVTYPLTMFWTDVHQVPLPSPATGTRQTTPRRADVLIEIDKVEKNELTDIFEFIHDKCSHVDGFG